MKPVPVYKVLIHALKRYGISEEEMIGIMLALDTPTKQFILLKWMAQHKDAISSDIIGKTMEIIVADQENRDNWSETV